MCILGAATALLAGPVEIAIVGALASHGVAAGSVDVLPDLERAAWMSTSPGAVIAVSRDAGAPGWVPLLEGRGAIDGRAAAYVCRQFVCRRPVTTADDLQVVLAM